MNKTANIILTLTLVLVLAVALLSGCGERTGLEGIYRLKSGSVLIAMTGENKDLEPNEIEKMDMQIHLKPGNKVTMISQGNATEGSYTVDGSIVSITVDGDTRDATLDGNTLKLSMFSGLNLIMMDFEKEE